MTPPDVCLLVFTCPACADWQVDVGPRARSDLGGAVAAFQEVAAAHMAHVLDDHTAESREAMRRAMESMGASADLTERTEGSTSAFLAGVPLPPWWVDKR